MCEPEEDISRGRRIGHAVVHDLAGVVTPSAGGKIVVGLERPAGGRRRPRDDSLVPDIGDGQQRRAGGLHGEQAPEAAGDGIISAAHRATGVRLADCAADGIHATRAGAATTRNFIPVNRVLLGVNCQRGQQQDKKSFHCTFMMMPLVM